MKQYPGIGSYLDAMALISTTVADPVLTNGRVETNAMGLPFARSGAFAYTFKINTRTGDYAFRVFQTKRSGMNTRYKAISTELASHPNSFFVDFEYQGKGILVNGESYPAIRMRWADGEPLGVYVEKNVKDSQRLRVLQQNLTALATSLEAAGIAHGDIQVGNVLVQNNGAVMLVDYDAMFVPALASMDSVEVGHPNFQHPERNLIQPFDGTLDRFSFALIHTALEGLIEKPSLWESFHSDSDAILLRGKDIADPHKSPLLRELTTMPRAGDFATRLMAMATAPYHQTPTFTDFLNGTNIPAGFSRTTSGEKPAAGTTASGTTSEVPWYQQPIVSSSPTSAQHRLHDEDMRIIDAREVDTVFEYAGTNALLVGRVAHVDTTIGSYGQPAVQLTLSTDGKRSVFVNIWAEGLKNFAAAGITIDSSWESLWITAAGTLSQPLGSPTGQHVNLTVTQTDDLQLTTYHDARRIIAGTELQQSNSKASTTQSVNNDDLVAILSSSTDKKKTNSTAGNRQGGASTQSPSSGASSSSPRNSMWTDARLWVFAIVGIVIAIIVGVLIIAAGNFTDSSSSSSLAPQPSVQEVEPYRSSWDTALLMFTGKCLTERDEIVSCQDDSAVARVSGAFVDAEDCGQWDSIKRQKGYICFVGMNEGITQSVTYETCTATTTTEGPTKECFPGEGWSYSRCWKRADGAVLQQRKGGKWVKEKDGISTKDNCDPDLPWTVDFDRKASGVGVKKYRVFVPATDLNDYDTDPITVTVSEK